MLCEKPLALDAAEAERVVDAADGPVCVLMEAFMYRFHPQWVAVSELVDDGRIGELGPSRLVLATSTTTPRTSATSPRSAAER